MDTPAILQRRRRVGAALPLDDALLLVVAGAPVPLPEASDQTYPFRSHAEYFYLTGHECAGGVLAFDPRDQGEADGGWTSFVPLVTEAERIWEGRTQPPGVPLAQLERWLAARPRRERVVLGASLPGTAASQPAARTEAVQVALHHARRPKDAEEMATFRRAVTATAAGFRRLEELLRVGVTERELQIELEAAFFRAGGERPGYGTIVGGGPNAAVLHFPPSDRPLREGEFVLIDAGAEITRYTADVTRTYVVGRPDSLQRDLHALVHRALQNTIARCVVGAEWKDVHLAAATDLTAGLVELGLMRGEPTSLVEREAHTLFFPHGIGHMVGLGVRDASGLAPGRVRDPRPSLRTLRMDLPLAENYLVTVEPGLYFIPPLLKDPARRKAFADAVDWTRVDSLLQLGGVRIEENVWVTANGPQVLTRDIPSH